MITSEQLRDVVGATAYDGSGDKIGKIGNVYFDDSTEQPKWLTVHTGLFGTNETFVPLQGADLVGDGRVTVGYDKAVVKDAPNISEDGRLSPEEEEQLYRYYGLDTGGGLDTGRDVDRTGWADPAGRTDPGDRTHAADHGGLDAGRHSLRTEDRAGAVDDGERAAVGRDTSGPVGDAAITRSEEQLRVGTETRETGRARLRKHVVTETEQATVPVSHEEVTIEREPITEANRGDAYDGPEITEEEHEVVLREERPVVDTEAVPVERIRVGTNTVQGQETVSGEVRKEVVDVDEDAGVGDTRDDVRDERR